MSPLTSSSFTEKVLARLGKLDRGVVDRFVRGVVRERNFYEAIFESLAEGVIVTDANLEVLICNRAACEMLEVHTRERVLGQSLPDVLRGTALSDILDEWTDDQRTVLEVTLGEDRLSDIVVTLLVVRDPEARSEIAARVLILTDITEHRQSERERARSERLASLAVLTAGVAHEIKNPLNAIRIHGQLLQHALGDAAWENALQEERSRRSVDIILEETQRLSHIVEQFMQAVRPVEPNLQRRNINDILRMVIDTLAPQQEFPDLDLDLDLGADLPTVWVDEQQMVQVFVNLIRNAMDAFDKPTRRLRVATRTREDAVEATISDNGCGISRDDLERVCQPYFTTKFNGTGLGLMTVHRIVGDHGGRILFQSREGEGTDVTVQLPTAERKMRLLTTTAPESEG
jgi:PAS domain S-box-containing protein